MWSFTINPRWGKVRCSEGKTHFLANKGMKRGTEYAGSWWDYLWSVIYFSKHGFRLFQNSFWFITIRLFVIILSLLSIALASHSRGKNQLCPCWQTNFYILSNAQKLLLMKANNLYIQLDLNITRCDTVMMAWEAFCNKKTKLLCLMTCSSGH